MKRLSNALVVSGMIFALFGCRAEKRPDGMPKLYLCTIFLTQEGSPVEGVDVILDNPDVSRRWIVGGMTDASGRADIRTHGRFSGAPTGTFKVVLKKNAVEGPADGKSAESMKIYSLVDVKYLDRKTTPLEISVDGKSTKESYEIGRPVRVLVETVRPGGP